MGQHHVPRTRMKFTRQPDLSLDLFPDLNQPGSAVGSGAESEKFQERLVVEVDRNPPAILGAPQQERRPEGNRLMRPVV